MRARARARTTLAARSRSLAHTFPLQSPRGAQHNLSAVTHSLGAAVFFVEQARQNSRAFPSAAALDAALIYNYAPLHGISSQFEAIYFVPQQQRA